MFLRSDRLERKEEHRSLLDALGSVVRSEAATEPPSASLESDEQSLDSIVVRHRPKESVDTSLSPPILVTMLGSDDGLPFTSRL